MYILAFVLNESYSYLQYIFQNDIFPFRIKHDKKDFHARFRIFTLIHYKSSPNIFRFEAEDSHPPKYLGHKHKNKYWA